MINVMRKLNFGSMKANKKVSNIKQMVKKRSLEKVILEGHFQRRLSLNDEFGGEVAIGSRLVGTDEFFFLINITILNTGFSSKNRENGNSFTNIIFFSR